VPSCTEQIVANRVAEKVSPYTGCTMNRIKPPNKAGFLNQISMDVQEENEYFKVGIARPNL